MHMLRQHAVNTDPRNPTSANPWQPLTIRRPRVTDGPEIWQLHVDQLRSTGAYAGDGPWDDDLRDIDASYLNDGGEFLVGVIDDEIVAMGGLTSVDRDTGEIKRMRVAAQFTRRGFAQQILDRLEARARELGYKHIVLDTSVDQIAAQHLYWKNGFRETSRGQWQGMGIIYYIKDIVSPD